MVPVANEKERAFFIAETFVIRPYIFIFIYTITKKSLEIRNSTKVLILKVKKKKTKTKNLVYIIFERIILKKIIFLQNRI